MNFFWKQPRHLPRLPHSSLRPWCSNWLSVQQMKYKSHVLNMTMVLQKALHLVEFIGTFSTRFDRISCQSPHYGCVLGIWYHSYSVCMTDSLILESLDNYLTDFGQDTSAWVAIGVHFNKSRFFHMLVYHFNILSLTRNPINLCRNSISYSFRIGKSSHCTYSEWRAS